MQVHSLATWRSYHRFKIGVHHLFDPTDSGELQQFAWIDGLPRLVEFQRLKNHIHPDFVAELETISQCFLRAVYLDPDAIEQMLLYACVQAGR